MFSLWDKKGESEQKLVVFEKDGKTKITEMKKGWFGTDKIIFFDFAPAPGEKFTVFEYKTYCLLLLKEKAKKELSTYSRLIKDSC